MRSLKAIFLTLVLAIVGQPATAVERPVPYWASITAGDALLRSGPGRNYPAMWRYRRVNLPVKVVQVHESWRRVREMDGTEGWMAAVLLSKQRTAMVVGEVREMRSSPDGNARLLWQVEPGVVGKIAHCNGGWCEFDISGRTGYIEADGIWGLDPGEVIP